MWILGKLKGMSLWLLGILGAISWGLLERTRRHKAEARRAEELREAEGLARNAEAGATDALIQGEQKKEKVRNEDNSNAATFND